MAPDSAGQAGELRFQPKSQRKILITGLFLLVMGVLSFSVMLAEPEKGRQDIFVMVVGLLVMLPLSLMALRTWWRTRNPLIIDAEGIRCANQLGRGVRWDQVADVELRHPFKIGELSVVLKDGRGRKLMAIDTEPYENGGRELLQAIQECLPHIFERRALEYIEGRKQWRYALTKNVVAFDGDTLLVNFPKPVVIPLKKVRQVQWVPGAISGKNKPGYVLIAHDGGRIELPQSIDGIHDFVFAFHHFDFRAAEPDAAPAATEGSAEAVPAAAAPEEDEAPVCATCQRASEGEYYLVDGVRWCPTCRSEALEPPPKGLGPLARMLGYGMCAGLMGALVWFSVAVMTERMFGLIAIAVGAMVGYGVKVGARHRGGRLPQSLAAALTFLALAYSTGAIGVYVIATDEEGRRSFMEGLAIGEGMVEEVAEEELSAEEAELAEIIAAEHPEIAEAIAAEQAEMAEQAEPAEQDGPVEEMELALAEEPLTAEEAGFVEAAPVDSAVAPAEVVEEMTAGEVVFMLAAGVLVALLAVVLVLPIMYVMFLFTDPINVLFLGWAVWNAWALNRRVVPEFTGPFTEAAAPAPEPASPLV